MQRSQLSGVDQRREQVTQVRKKKRRGMYRSLNLDPRAKGSYFNLNHDLIKFKSTCLLQYEEKLLPDNLTKAHGWLVMMKTFFFVSLSLLPLSNLSLSLRWAPASAWKAGDPDSIPGRSPGEGNGNPLHYSCLKNPMDRRPWRATVHWVAKSQTWLND